jgi:hypothetical protein
VNFAVYPVAVPVAGFKPTSAPPLQSNDPPQYGYGLVIWPVIVVVPELVTEVIVNGILRCRPTGGNERLQVLLAVAFVSVQGHGAA